MTTRLQKKPSSYVPYEVWSAILSWLPEEDLKNSSLVCKLFRQLSEKFLWHELNFARSYEKLECLVDLNIPVKKLNVDVCGGRSGWTARLAQKMGNKFIRIVRRIQPLTSLNLHRVKQHTLGTANFLPVNLPVLLSTLPVTHIDTSWLFIPHPSSRDEKKKTRDYVESYIDILINFKNSVSISIHPLLFEVLEHDDWRRMTKNGLRICRIDASMNSFYLQKKINLEEYFCILSSIQPPPKVVLTENHYFSSVQLKKALDALNIVSLWWPRNVNEVTIRVLEDSKKIPDVHIKKECMESLSPGTLQRLERFNIVVE